MEVSKIVSHLLSVVNQSITDLNHEILTVIRALLKAASPSTSNRKKKIYIVDDDLRRLCKESCEAWMEWKNAGRPTGHSLREEMFQ